MKIKKYNECSVEFNNIENVKVVSSNFNENQIKELAKAQFSKYESCNSDFKEMLIKDIAKIEIKKYYAPVYNIECMVNDDYRVSFEEEGNAVVHVVCGNNEARIDEEQLPNLVKEEVVRFEGDYHFCCSDYKGAFDNRLVHLELATLNIQEEDLDELDIIDRFISSKALDRLITDKVKQAFLGQGVSQAKKYISSRHKDAKLLDCTQESKIIDTKKGLYLIPIYEVVATFAEEEYTSYIAGVDSMTEFDFPRAKSFIDYNKKSRLFYFIRTLLIELMFVLIAGAGIFGAIYAHENYDFFTKNHLTLTSIGLALLCIILLIIYILKRKKYRAKKDFVLAKYENAKKKPKTLYLITMIIYGVIDLLLITLTILLII